MTGDMAASGLVAAFPVLLAYTYYEGHRLAAKLAIRLTRQEH